VSSEKKKRGDRQDPNKKKPTSEGGKRKEGGGELWEERFTFGRTRKPGKEGPPDTPIVQQAGKIDAVQDKERIPFSLGAIAGMKGSTFLTRKGGKEIIAGLWGVGLLRGDPLPCERQRLF